MDRNKAITGSEVSEGATQQPHFLRSDSLEKSRKQNALAQPQLIISIKEARKKLPKHLREKLSDEQVEFIVVRLQSIAREFIDCSVPQG